MTNLSLTFYRWARLRDFVNDGLALRRIDVLEFIHDGYLEHNDGTVTVTVKGRDALLHEPTV